MHTLVVVIYILARVVWIVAVECARRMDTLLCILLLESILREALLLQLLESSSYESY